jgi:hypothetical protein
LSSIDFWLVRNTIGIADHSRVAEHEIRRQRLDLGERVEPVGSRGDAVASLFQADFEHAHAARIGVDEKQFLLGQGLR